MTDQKTQIKLTEEGSRRRKQMLTDLQSEVLRNRQRRQKHACLVMGAAMVLIASTIWIVNGRFNQHQDLVEQIPAPSSQAVGQMEESMSAVPLEFSRVSFETISDEELLTTLSKMGQPSVLGEIGGETRVISQLGPQRWTSNDTGS